MQLHIGLDDTDSTKGGCTTYIAARLVEETVRAGAQFIDYPNVVRLNPNIPYKTRGNAAVSLRVTISEDSYDTIQEVVLQEVEENSELGRKGTDPAVVFLRGPVPEKVKNFSRRALWDVLSEKEAIRILKTAGANAATYGTRIGLVGALAAVGQTLDRDHTFELIAYRHRSNYGKPRLVDEASIIRMDRLTKFGTFNNYDCENRRILITPHGPDPVLVGIRGEEPDIVRYAFHLLKLHEPVERWLIFRTNHGTDAHFQSMWEKGELLPNRPAVLRGIVENTPKRILGGHVFFNLRSGNGRVCCAAFEPTGGFRQIIANLLPGDEVTVFGAVKERRMHLPLTINLEKIDIHRLVGIPRFENPRCPKCLKHMKSAGKGQGFECKRCSVILRSSVKQVVEDRRPLLPGIYVPALKSHRHLTKPLIRYGREKEYWNGRPPLGQWHEP